MSKTEADIHKGLRSLFPGTECSFLAVVKSVAGEYCNVIDDGFEYHEVRLRASINGNSNKTLLVPATGSWVIVSRIKSSDELFVSMFSEVEKVFLRGSQFGGMVKVEALIQRLNAIENAFNSFLNEYKMHVHSGGTAPSGSTGTTISVQQPISPITRRSDIENTEVTHG